jgi:hypothetical protein
MARRIAVLAPLLNPSTSTGPRSSRRSRDAMSSAECSKLATRSGWLGVCPCPCISTAITGRVGATSGISSSQFVPIVEPPPWIRSSGVVPGRGSPWVS